MKLIILISMIVIILVLLTVFRRVGRQLTERQIIKSQQIVNAALNEAIAKLTPTLGILPTDKPYRSTLVANIWGHEVMAFEFAIPVEREVNANIIRKQVNLSLANYAKTHGIKGFDPNEPALLITDLWFNAAKDTLHLDIAHVGNQETVAYLHDLRRLNQTD